MLCPETYPVILGHEPAASSAMADTADWICLRNAKGVLITILEAGANATDLILDVHQGVTGTGTLALTTGAEFPIWINLLTTTTDAMVRQTDGVGYTIPHSAIPRVVQFYVPASVLSAGYSWIQLGSSAGHATNIVSVTYQLDGASYQQATPPTAIA